MLRIALISDIHFGELARTKEFSMPGVMPKGETKGAASLTDGLVKILIESGAQYLFIAGDLTSRARPQEFYYCEEKIVSIATAAGIPIENIVWGVGNHDVDWAVSKLANIYEEGESEIYRIAKDKYRLIASSVALMNLNKFPKAKDVGPVSLTGVVETDTFIAFVLNSSTYCTHDQEFSHGKLSVQQLEWFKLVAQKYENDTRWKVVLMHHHPHNYTYHIPSVDISTLEEGSEFTEIAGDAGIHLVLHGHRHHPRAETILKNGWKNPISFICAGSLSVNAEHRSNGDIPNTFHIIELTDKVGVLQLYNYEYSASDGWKPLLNNKRETPMDAQMKLGGVCTEEEIDKLILEMANFEGEFRKIVWNDLDEKFHFWGADRLNKRMAELLSATHDISSKFPHDVHLIKLKKEDSYEA